MPEDDILRDVRMAREEYCEQFGYDISAIVRDLHERERAGGRRVIRRPPRRPEPSGLGGVADPNIPAASGGFGRPEGVAHPTERPDRP